METAVVAVYLACMLAFGVWGRIRAKNQEDFLVAGRRLGPLVFMGTMAAVVLGGASTVGGVGLGYVHGLSGMWLVVCIGLGIIILSLLFAPTIQRLEIYTVSQMLELRYGIGSRTVSGIIMTAYGLMISTTSTVAYGAIFHSLLGIDRVPAVLIGGAVVIVYSMLGGMWSITMTDFVQFLIQTVGIFIILLPIVLTDAGGFTAIRNAVGPEAFDPVAIGPNMIITYVLIYTIGLLIGQDIWQRVFTARSPGTARWGGFAAGVYCVLYGAAGALVGVGPACWCPASKTPTRCSQPSPNMRCHRCLPDWFSQQRCRLSCRRHPVRFLPPQRFCVRTLLNPLWPSAHRPAADSAKLCAAASCAKPGTKFATHGSTWSVWESCRSSWPAS